MQQGVKQKEAFFVGNQLSKYLLQLLGSLMHCMVDMMDLNSERKLPAVQGVSTCGIHLLFTKAKGTHHLKVSPSYHVLYLAHQVIH